MFTLRRAARPADAPPAWPLYPTLTCVLALVLPFVATSAHAGLVTDAQAGFDTLLQDESSFTADDGGPSCPPSTGNLQLERFGAMDGLPVLYLPRELESFVAAVQVNGSARLLIDSEAAVDEAGPWAWFGRWRRNNLNYASIDIFRTSAGKLTRVWWRVSSRFLRLSDAVSSSSLVSFVEKSASHIDARVAATSDPAEERDTHADMFGSSDEDGAVFSSVSVVRYAQSYVATRNSTFAPANNSGSWASARATAPNPRDEFPSSPTLANSAGITAVSSVFIAPDAEIVFANPGPPSNLSPVPEPSTWSGLACLAAAIALWRIGQRKPRSEDS